MRRALCLFIALAFFPGQQLALWRDPDDRTSPLHRQPPGLQNDVQCQWPRHLLQAQRHGTGHTVTGDDIDAREFGETMQHCTYFGLLEVER